MSQLDAEELTLIAKAKRSEARNLRPLRELALERIRNVCSCIQSSTVLYRNLSPSLRIDILKYLESQGEFDKPISPELKGWIFEILNRLLDASVRDFDFILFSQFESSEYLLDKNVWQMLVEKCPNLERVADSRKLALIKEDMIEDGEYESNEGFCNFHLNDVLPFLIKLPMLEHIELGWYICDEECMAQIAKNFPNLRSLSIAIEAASFDLLRSLFTLQRLEILKVNWEYKSSLSKSFEIKRFEQSRLMQECLRHLPLLRVCCSDNSVDTIRAGVFDLHSFQGLAQPALYLETAKIVGAFDFRLVPSLINLRFEEPVNIFVYDFSNLFNLRVLHLSCVKGLFVIEVLSYCGSQLEELTIFSTSHAERVDPFEIFSLCPQLRKLDFNMNISIANVETSSASVNQSNFNRMTSFEFHSSSDSFPSKLIFYILSAPNIEHFCVYNDLSIVPDSLIYLSDLLVKGHILQMFRIFQFGCQSEQVQPELIRFLCLLPSYAPKLKLLTCSSASREFANQLSDSLLPNITLSEFDFEGPFDQDEELEG
ncbi:uncharacterized protein LOC132205801 [Neocloeon triangulifer]|uniref:uncharacterized protein LOC132205801 n=1 Tax=Neocloeon triangulifer TaxID=2078957 RepID=UPI00286F8F6A|nr:uncharacterized protein LOC132205801 [Neocloeon triangulifer]